MSGGESNVAAGNNAVISGGRLNTSSGNKNRFVVIGGGFKNNADGLKSAITGGEQNSLGLKALLSFIGGGSSNVVNGEYSVVAGGKGNSIDADSTKSATIVGGMDNSASGNNAAVIGGSNNVASGTHSIAMGFQAVAEDEQSFVINLAAGGAQSSGTSQFLVNSDLFTISIGGEEASITDSNIDALCDELSTCNGRRLESIHSLQEQIGKQNEAVESMRTKIESFIVNNKSSN